MKKKRLAHRIRGRRQQLPFANWLMTNSAQLPGERCSLEQDRFKFDVFAVLKAVTALAEHATDGTITADIKCAWAHEHASLFPFPPAPGVADHIERCAGFRRTTAELVTFVLGKERVKTGLGEPEQENSK